MNDQVQEADPKGLGTKLVEYALGFLFIWSFVLAAIGLAGFAHLFPGRWMFAPYLIILPAVIASACIQDFYQKRDVPSFVLLVLGLWVSWFVFSELFL
jgi:hypothetical protein